MSEDQKHQSQIDFKTPRISDSEKCLRRQGGSSESVDHRRQEGEQDDIAFDFKVEGNTLIITAHFHRKDYICPYPLNPSISFDRIKKKLLMNPKQFIIKNDWDERSLEIQLLDLVTFSFRSHYYISLEQTQKIFVSCKQKLDQLKEKYQSKFNNMNSSFQEQIKSFVDKFTQQSTTNMNGIQDKINQQNRTIQKQSNALKQQSDAIQQLKNEQSSLKKQSAQNKTTQNQLNSLKTQFDQLITQTIPKCITYKTQIFRGSEIVCQAHEELTLRNFFTNKTIKQVKLLYRASENEFCSKKFHEKCDKIPNTLTVIQTGFYKKIGGFTPLEWGIQSAYVVDNLKQSFIFSLTHNDKFALIQPQKAIYNDQGYGPVFGSGYDLSVSNKSNLTSSCYGNIYTSYQNINYQSKNSAAWERFHGGSTNSYLFKAIEWEVWAVEFK